MKGKVWQLWTDRLIRLAAAVVLVLSLLFMFYLTVVAFVETVDINISGAAGELVDVYKDNIFLNAIVIVLLLSSLYVFTKYRDEISLWKLELILMICTFLLGVAFIVSVKLAAPWYTDSYILTYAAQRAAVGDMGALDNYFVHFPFQLGYVLYVEIAFRLMGSALPGMPAGYYHLALQGLNLLWLMLCYHAIISMVGKLFQSLRMQKMTALLLIFCLPPVLSCTFLYGNIPSFSAGCVALWMFAAFLRDKRVYHGLLCAAFMGLAVALKLNMMIFFVAVVIIWLLELLRDMGFKSVLCLALTVASVLTVSALPQDIYEKRSGKDFGDGIPMIAWMAMGFSEGHAGPGWYKEDNTVTYFSQSGMDAQATAEHAKQVIAEQLDYFKSQKGEVGHFFSLKLRSQWNEPSYESLWINKVQQSYGEKKGLYTLFCAAGERATIGYMNQYQQLIFLGVLLSVITMWRRRDTRDCLILVIILGGVLYHLLFEAKSQYSLTYFVLMVPMAAYGYSCFFAWLDARKTTHT